MAKYHGKVGYVHTVETAPGVHEEQASERVYFGDVVQNRRILQQAEQVNPAVILGNSISIVADAYAREHFFAIRYLEWAGVLWRVSDVDVQHPRLLLRLGEVYHGLTPSAP